jgi:hypothetical protein
MLTKLDPYFMGYVESSGEVHQEIPGFSGIVQSISPSWD